MTSEASISVYPDPLMYLKNLISVSSPLARSERFVTHRRQHWEPFALVKHHIFKTQLPLTFVCREEKEEISATSTCWGMELLSSATL